MQIKPNSEVVQKRLLKVAQAASYLSISPDCLRKLVKDQQLQVVKFVGPWLLDIRDLDRFIESHKEFA